MAQKPKFAKNSAQVETDNGEVTFIAARSVKNLNGYKYNVATLQAQDATGEYHTLTNEPLEVSIPLMLDHKAESKDKIGSIDSAKIVTVDGVDHVEMHAKFFKGDEAQAVRQRVLDGELTDVSITTDWGDATEEDDGSVLMNNAHIVEVSVVYAGAEPKAKILASNSVDTEETEAEETEEVEEADETETVEVEDQKTTNPEVETPEVETEENKKEEEEMATQPTNAPAEVTEKVATKAQVMNSLTKLAKSGAIRNMTKNQVVEAIKNDVTITDADGSPYVVPDAVFTEIFADRRPTDILETFQSVPAKRWTVMGEVPSDADLARAGRWSKGEQKQIQESDLKAQKLSTQFIYKMQELSYEDMQEDFGDVLYQFIVNELPQKLDEEEERAFIVGDGRASGNPRKITSIVSLDAAAEDSANVHVAKYDGSGDSSVMEAILKGIEKIETEGTLHLVSNGSALGAVRRAGLANASGLPFGNDVIADALGVDGLHKRKYVPANVVYVWVENSVKRLTGPTDSIEQYDIDYNNQKIERIRPAGGAATGLYSAVKIVLPASVSA